VTIHRPISTLLIANRGEIACRIIRTARRMGVRTVAVYSEADARGAHVALADDAVLIGPAPARESYLRVEALLDAARRTGADAVHPGYGFLAENADFAEACAAAGLVFLGPPPSAIRAMGSKSAAKSLMETASVPLVPGYHGEDQSPILLAAEAGRIGFPVLIKASAGGGGKGMKIVRSADDFADALASAKREAASAFGDDRVLVEKYLTRPRHIEIQVFADGHGHCLYLNERDCSVQRRHQKVLEEAPAPGMTPERRAAMGKAAVDAAQAVGYVGAGTVEFIAEGDGFYFMEMNTRLQVEHPVTEAITGLDLVEWQIRVARGESLPITQDQVPVIGHAVEARLYAEDPQRDFLPQTGRLVHLALPEGMAGIRVDAGVRTGDAVSVHYDPMIAKIIAHGADRTEALGRLAAALDATEVAGLSTNRAFLARLARHPAFGAADLDTGFIERYRDDLLPSPRPANDGELALATLSLLLRRGQPAQASDPWSPWDQADGFRINRDNHVDLHLIDGDQTVMVRAHYRADGYVFDLPGGSQPVQGRMRADGGLELTLGGHRRVGRVIADGATLTLFLSGAERRLIHFDPRSAQTLDEGAAGKLTAPMPGKVIAVKVAVGDKVSRGAALMVVEAMKMEHTIHAPGDGEITAIAYGVGDLVEDGAELLVLTPAEDAA